MSTRDPTPYGRCHCGCGGKTLVSTYTHSARQRYKGQPLRFIHGHNAKRAVHILREDRGCETPCWIWQLHTHAEDGHGRFEVDGRVQMAHRVYYEREHGPLAKGLHLHHKCEQPGCVNPAHLEPLTPAEHKRAHSDLTWDDVDEMRRLRAAGVKRADVAERFGISATQVTTIVRGRNWVR